MHRDTHIYVSDVALDLARGRNIELDRELFLFGSIVPDYSPMHKVIRHYLNSSFDYVKTVIEKVVGMRDVRQVSFYLGIVAHYIADYFCSPHYNHQSLLSKDALKHIEYEKDMKLYMVHHDISTSREYEFSNVESLVLENLGDYNNRQSFKEDLDFAISNILNVLFNVNKWGLAI